MCSPECFKWTARNITREEIEGKRVLEIGAYDVNGSLRYVIEMLKPSEYIGSDIEAGPGVDLVCPAEELIAKFGEDSFDVVISANVLEHILDWRSAVSTMKRILKPGGTLLVIAPSIWVYHAHPGDYWRYNAQDFRAIFSDLELMNVHEDPAPPALAYAKFRKPADFKEKDLRDYELYSIVKGTRTVNIVDADYRSLAFRKTLLKYKAKMAGLALARRIFRQV
jgi:SAM-dependent methyltransferase